MNFFSTLWQNYFTHNIRNNIDLQHAIFLMNDAGNLQFASLLLPIKSLVDEQHNCTVIFLNGDWERKLL